jgi:hypothetical protein
MRHFPKRVHLCADSAVAVCLRRGRDLKSRQFARVTASLLPLCRNLERRLSIEGQQSTNSSKLSKAQQLLRDCLLSDDGKARDRVGGGLESRRCDELKLITTWGDMSKGVVAGCGGRRVSYGGSHGSRS